MYEITLIHVNWEYWLHVDNGIHIYSKLLSNRFNQKPTTSLKTVEHIGIVFRLVALCDISKRRYYIDSAAHVLRYLTGEQGIILGGIK